MIKLFAPALMLCALLPWGAVGDVSPPVPVDAGGPLRIAAEPEVVFDWRTDRCENEQFPDLPVRAFRNPDGDVTLILSHYSAYRMTGLDFDTLTLSCTPIMRSRRDPLPENFANHEWIASVHAQADGTVHALVHNEFQGNRYPALCPSADYFRCWYNAITYARSDDGGASFDRPFDAPDHLVATIPHPFEPDEGIFGAFSPSNIITRDGLYYAFFKLQSFPFGDQRVCLMRTPDLSDPSAWRYWTGRDFSGLFADPYRDDLIEMRVQTCPAVALPEIAEMHASVTWNTALQRYILVGVSNDPARADNVFGVYYALSEDLVTWSRRQPLLEMRLPWRASGRETVYLYPSLIDHDSDSLNFETTGTSAWLYLTRMNSGPGEYDRDLLRFEVTISAP